MLPLGQQLRKNLNLFFFFYDWVIYAQSMTQSPKSPNDHDAAAAAGWVRSFLTVNYCGTQVAGHVASGAATFYNNIK